MTALDLEDTIVAVASATGPAARGIVRACGPNVLDCVAPHFCANDGVSEIPSPLAGEGRGEGNGNRVHASPLHPNPLPQGERGTAAARRIEGTLHLPALHHPLDVALYLWPDAQSFTRQPTIELHTIGSPPLLRAIVELLCVSGARAAKPGEFTLRAFLAGRLDLTQAEAVLGVIDAVDRRQLDVALAQLAGGLAGPLQTLRNALIELLAHLEAGLDFVDEDIEFISAADLQRQLEAARATVRTIADRLSVRSLADDLVRVVLYGSPNAGKSSLFNALLGRSDAIVSDVAGTTRDWLAARLDLDGVPCELIDTAGLDALVPEHAIDQQAQTSTLERRRQAHVALHCIEATSECSPTVESPSQATVVWTKADLVNDSRERVGIVTSVVTGIGIDALKAHLREAVLAARCHDAEVVANTAARIAPVLRSADEALEQAIGFTRENAGEELVAAELRLSLDALGEIVGAIYTDDILDRVFSRFCIGK